MTNLNLVEGDWKSFTFKMAKPEDTPRILDLLRKNFFPHELLCKPLCTEEREFDIMAKDLSVTVETPLKDNLSFFVEDKKTGKLAGVSILALVRKGEDNNEPLHFELPASSVVVNFLSKASDQVDIFKIYPDVDQYGDFVIAATSSEFREQGIAKEMFRRALSHFQSKGIPVCKSILTSPYTVKICKSLNFTEHDTLFLKDYKDEKGNLYYPNASPEQYIVVVSKRI